MKKLLIICGPTATGKTKLGINLAQKFNGEIISADSRQVYRGMNIGTGKEVVGGKWEMSREVGYGKWVVGGIPIWLLDIVEPNYRFNVADYKRCADVVLEDIWKRKKQPIIVGGTGFYIKAITEEIETIGVSPDWQLREKLSNFQADELRKMLKELDPERFVKMNESDRQNPRRLIRAIEVAQKCKVQSPVPSGTGQSSKACPELVEGCKVTVQSSKFNTLFVGLTAPYDVLYQRIDQRVDERVEAGIEDEIKGLLKKGYNWENSALGTTLAYCEWQDYFEKKKNKDKIIPKWKFDEHNYARRQMTWFRKNPKINWFGITEKNLQEKVEKMVENWYTHK